MTILTDHDIEGQAKILWGALVAEGWVDLLELRLAGFSEVGLPSGSDDRKVWQFAQANGMILLTGNRRMERDDSLERTIREENSARSIPVVTIGNKDRVREQSYRDRCVAKLAEIIFDLENLRGVGRLFIP